MSEISDDEKKMINNILKRLDTIDKNNNLVRNKMKEVKQTSELLRNCLNVGHLRKSEKYPEWYYKSGLNKLGWPIMDHVICRLNHRGTKVIESRPYSACSEQLLKLIEICAINRLDFEIYGKSDYNNESMTIKIYDLAEDIMNKVIRDEVIA